ncbi:MAG: hypothetical protein H6670_10745 [Anaerolineaceae bacterium]|nr:hypothetical protein [Anaerolineaceae bacterium]
MSDNSKDSANNSYSNISGGNINFGTQHGNVTVNYGIIRDQATDDTKRHLFDLLEKLQNELQILQEQHNDEVETIALFAQQAAAQAMKEPPNRTALKITGDSLKQAAQNLLAVSPIVAQIAKVLLQIGT